MGTNNHTSKEYWMHITKIKKKKNYFHAKATLLLIKNKQANKRDNQA
jgi:hypothetical protein